MKTDCIDYQDGDVALEGYFAWDETCSEPRPLVLVAHDSIASGLIWKAWSE
jgi:hypothetical protein